MKKNDFQELAKHVISAYDEVTKTWQAVEEVAKVMDGKVFNKRFTDAVNVKCENITRFSVVDSYGLGKEMNIYLKHRDFTLGTYCVYFDSRVNWRQGMKLDNILNDAGRIDAAKASEFVKKMCDNISNEVTRWSDASENWDKYEKKLREALAAFSSAVSEINPMFQPWELHSYDWKNASSFDMFKK